MTAAPALDVLYVFSAEVTELVVTRRWTGVRYTRCPPPGARIGAELYHFARMTSLTVMPASSS